MKIHPISRGFLALAAGVLFAGSASSSTLGAEFAQKPSPSAPSDTSPPEPADGYDWYLRIDTSQPAASATLAFEMEDSDDQPLIFQCEEGGRRLFAGFSGSLARTTSIALSSGAETGVYGGVTEETEIPELPYFTSDEIPIEDPVIQAFIETGWLRMTVNGSTIGMASRAVTRGHDAIEEFWAFCN